MFLSKPLVLALAGLTVSTAKPSSPDPLVGYDIVNMTWSVEVFRRHPPHTLNGTVEEVYDQIRKINPAFELKPRIKRDISAPIGSTVPGKLLCSDFPTAYCEYVKIGMDYLDGIAGKPGALAGPKLCGRVSCGYNAAIYWCNDVSAETFIPSSSQMLHRQS
jgi:hypothetical protein